MARRCLPPIGPPHDAGVYLAVFHLAGRRTIQVGRLGRFDFPAGFYFYVGSAQRNLPARLARHARRRKPRRWHIDYLAAHATMVGAWSWPADRAMETELARALSERYATPARGFGASDSPARTHLFHGAVTDR